MALFSGWMGNRFPWSCTHRRGPDLVLASGGTTLHASLAPKVLRSGCHAAVPEARGEYRRTNPIPWAGTMECPPRFVVWNGPRSWLRNDRPFPSQAPHQSFPRGSRDWEDSPGSAYRSVRWGVPVSSTKFLLLLDLVRTRDSIPGIERFFQMRTNPQRQAPDSIGRNVSARGCLVWGQPEIQIRGRRESLGCRLRCAPSERFARESCGRRYRIGKSSSREFHPSGQKHRVSPKLVPHCLPCSSGRVPGQTFCRSDASSWSRGSIRQNPCWPRSRPIVARELGRWMGCRIRRCPSSIR